MTLDTIYSVGEGRTVVVAVDGCSSCLDAFEEFVKNHQEAEDRIVAVVKGGRPKMSQGKYSGPLLLSGTAKAKAKALEEGLDDELGCVAERPECKVRNRVIVPDQPLTDFQDWDRTSRNTLTKLAARAASHKTRFEAVRVLAGGRPQHFAEAVVECCVELDASLLVIGSHRPASSSASGTGRSLSAVFSAHTTCPILVLGKRSAPETEEREEDLRPSTPDLGSRKAPRHYRRASSSLFSSDGKPIYTRDLSSPQATMPKAPLLSTSQSSGQLSRQWSSKLTSFRLPLFWRSATVPN